MDVPDQKKNEQKNVILVVCPPKPGIDERLEQLVVIIRKKITNIVIDFSDVNVITASNISALLILRELLESEGHRLILSGINSRIKNVFVVTKLHRIFEFTDDKTIAMTAFNVA